MYVHIHVHLANDLLYWWSFNIFDEILSVLYVRELKEVIVVMIVFDGFGCTFFYLFLFFYRWNKYVSENIFEILYILS